MRQKRQQFIREWRESHSVAGFKGPMLGSKYYARMAWDKKRKEEKAKK